MPYPHIDQPTLHGIAYHLFDVSLGRSIVYENLEFMPPAGLLVMYPKSIFVYRLPGLGVAPHRGNTRMSYPGWGPEFGFSQIRDSYH
jgi:hypothetical protein